MFWRTWFDWLPPRNGSHLRSGENKRTGYDLRRRLRIEPLEARCLLASWGGQLGDGSAGGAAFVPPPSPITPTNPVQTVRVIVLNFEPTVPSADNQSLWEIFGWNDPRELAAGFVADVETASGGAIDYQIIEWRDLNEFPIFTDGFRYTADEYVQNRMTNTGWSTSTADFYAIAEQQGLADLVNANVVDEIWAFGDHFFSLFGEAWMAGPESFFINGPSFYEFPVDRAVAGFGFSYERGVAEMLHNLGHRTENHGSRAYGGWNIENPVTPWDYFTANVGQTNRTTFGVGSTHFPFNGMDHYDYANPGVVDSYADDFVLNFPNQTYAAVPMSRDAWGDLGIGNWERGYQRWFFGHVPRGDGTAADGRQNNWYKYIYDFNSYEAGTGLPRDNDVVFGAAPLSEPGSAAYDFTLRFYDVQGIDPTTLDGADVTISGPGGTNLLATVVAIGAEQATTAGTARTVRYQIDAPGGNWDEADSGTYTVSLQADQVRDLSGAFLPAAVLGDIQINVSDATRIDVAAMLATAQASVDATPWDIGGPAAIFDNSTSSLYRTPNIDPAVVTLSFVAPQTLTGFRGLFAGGDYRWQVEAADSLADLDGQAGTYQLLVPFTSTPSNVFSSVTLGAPVSATHVRLTAERLTGDDYVHINSWELLGTAVADTAPPSATLLGTPTADAGENTTNFAVQYTDDTAIDIRHVNFGDIRVTGPDGFVQTAAFYGLDVNADGPARDAAYFISAPGGVWDSTDNGLYFIELMPQQVFDKAGKPVAAALLGSFNVELPPPESRPRADLTELNAVDWFAWADGATASTSDDAARKTLGAASVRFDTTGGFDTYLRYEPAAGTAWDLSDADQFYLNVFAENPSPFGFQESTVRFIDLDGDAMEFRYWKEDVPYPIWNDARGAWLAQTIAIKSGAQPATGWRGTAIGTPDWSRMRTVEIHADTWDSGFSLWFDRVGFNLPVSVTSASFNVATTPRHRLTLVFDESIGATLATDDLQVRNLSTSTSIPASSLAIASTQNDLAREISFPGYVNGVLPDGLYLVSLPRDSVADAAGNALSADFEFTFAVLNGDYNGDFAVNAADYVIWRNALGHAGDFTADGDGSGGVDRSDYDYWKSKYGHTLPPPELLGDYNYNRRVDAADYSMWRNSLGRTGVTPFGGADGDGDGDITRDDYDVWKSHFGQPVPASGAEAGGSADDELTRGLEAVLLAITAETVPLTPDAGSALVIDRTLAAGMTAPISSIAFTGAAGDRTMSASIREATISSSLWSSSARIDEILWAWELSHWNEPRDDASDASDAFVPPGAADLADDDCFPAAEEAFGLLRDARFAAFDLLV
ncbi:MAG: hypothetical protein WD669_06755 [Pirellulales bacterium]